MGLGSPCCGQCRMEVESIIHVLRDCLRAIELWSYLVRRDVRSLFVYHDLEDWISDNFTQSFGWDMEGGWTVVWATTYATTFGCGETKKFMRRITQGLD